MTEHNHPSVLDGLTGDSPRRGRGFGYLGPQGSQVDRWLDDVPIPAGDYPGERTYRQENLWSGWKSGWKPSKPASPPKPPGPDRLIPCTAHPGRRHWGANGAAGVLVWTRRHHATYVLMALRGKGVQSGNTWSGTIGGAIGDGESEWQAASREATEEADGLTLGRISGSVVYTCDCGWTYTTFVTFMQAGRTLPDIRPSDWETQAFAWVRADDVALWPALHHRFAQAWPALRKLAGKGR